GLLPGFLQRDSLAAVPLLRGWLSLQRRAVRSLSAHEPALCAAPRAHAGTQRPGVGARLPSVSARAEIARSGSDSAHRALPAHPFPALRSAARIAGVRRAAAIDACLRRARIPDRLRS